MGRHKRLYTGHWTQQALLSFPCIYRPCPPPPPFDSALFAVMEPGSLAVGDRVSFGFLYFFVAPFLRGGLGPAREGALVVTRFWLLPSRLYMYSPSDQRLPTMIVGESSVRFTGAGWKDVAHFLCVCVLPPAVPINERHTIDSSNFGGRVFPKKSKSLSLDRLTWQCKQRRWRASCPPRRR